MRGSGMCWLRCLLWPLWSGNWRTRVQQKKSKNQKAKLIHWKVSSNRKNIGFYINIHIYNIYIYIIWYNIWYGGPARHAGLAGRPDFLFRPGASMAPYDLSFFFLSILCISYKIICFSYRVAYFSYGVADRTVCLSILGPCGWYESFWQLRCASDPWMTNRSFVPHARQFENRFALWAGCSNIFLSTAILGNLHANRTTNFKMLPSEMPCEVAQQDA